MSEQGFTTLSPSVLNFLSALDCGVNHSAEIARRLEVSRQMVGKTVKELVALGYLEQGKSEGTRKTILFTERGEQLMSAARLMLSEMDKTFFEQFGQKTFNETADKLEQLCELI